MHDKKPQTTFDSFAALDIRIGTIIDARRNEGARKPAYVLSVDCGELGVFTTSAQVTDHYGIEDIVGRQVAAVVNFPPRKIADVHSEVLILGAVANDGQVVLLAPEQQVSDGLPVG